MFGPPPPELFFGLPFELHDSNYLLALFLKLIPVQENGFVYPDNKSYIFNFQI